MCRELHNASFEVLLNQRAKRSGCYKRAILVVCSSHGRDTARTVAHLRAHLPAVDCRHRNAGLASVCGPLVAQTIIGTGNWSRDGLVAHQRPYHSATKYGDLWFPRGVSYGVVTAGKWASINGSHLRVNTHADSRRRQHDARWFPERPRCGYVGALISLTEVGTMRADGQTVRAAHTEPPQTWQAKLTSSSNAGGSSSVALSKA